MINVMTTLSFFCLSLTVIYLVKDWRYMKRTIEELKAGAYAQSKYLDRHHELIHHTLCTVLSRLDKLEEAEPKVTEETLNV